MKILVILFTLVTFAFGAGESCYSVQLTSVYKTQQSLDELKANVTKVKSIINIFINYSFE